MVVADLVPAVIAFDRLAGLRGRDIAATYHRMRIYPLLAISRAISLTRTSRGSPWPVPPTSLPHRCV